MPHDLTPSLTVRATTRLMLWSDRLADDEGQATTEYALVLLGAALVALLLVAWASSGGTAGKIGRLFDRVIDSIIQKL